MLPALKMRSDDRRGTDFEELHNHPCRSYRSPEHSGFPLVRPPYTRGEFVQPSSTVDEMRLELLADDRGEHSSQDLPVVSRQNPS